MKTQTVLRMMRTGVVYHGRTVLRVEMPRAAWLSVASPMDLEAHANIKSADFDGRRLNLLVKMHDPATDEMTARFVRRALQRIRRGWSSARVTVLPHHWRERKH